MADSEEMYPDLFFDGAQVTVTIYGANMTFTLSNPHPKDQSDALKAKKILTARTSLEHAKIFTMMLKRQLKQYEIATDIEIKVPPDVYSGLGLDENDW